MRCKEGDIIKKGYWTTLCCEEDLQENDEDFVVSDDEEEIGMCYWKTKDDALKELRP